MTWTFIGKFHEKICDNSQIAAIHVEAQISITNHPRSSIETWYFDWVILNVENVNNLESPSKFPLKIEIKYSCQNLFFSVKIKIPI
jgi:hypothetical protein